MTFTAETPDSPTSSSGSDVPAVGPIPPPQVSLPDTPSSSKIISPQKKHASSKHVPPRTLPPPKKKPRLVPVKIQSPSHIPNNPLYHRSYMHRSIVTHVSATPRHLVTASQDGQLTFWARDVSNPTKPTSTDTNPSTSINPATNLHFIKSFRAHLGPLSTLQVSTDARTVITMSLSDNTLKLFSIPAFDMVDFVKLPFIPSGPVCIASIARGVQGILVPHHAHQTVSFFPLDNLLKERRISLPHLKKVILLTFNRTFNSFISVDEAGIIEYWAISNIIHPEEPTPAVTNIPGVQFRSKLRTDLFIFAKKHILPYSLSSSPDGTLFVTTASDRVVRVFNFATGTIIRSYDESLANITNTISPTLNSAIPAQEFGRRMARERQVSANPASLARANAVFDETSNYILYATVMGIRVTHIPSNQCVTTLALREAAERFLAIAVSDCDSGLHDDVSAGQANLPPLLVASSFDSQRIYIFGSGEGVATGRDVFNERPMARGADEKGHVDSENKSSPPPKRVTLHTTAGDIVISFSSSLTPKTVKNFSTHCSNGYFDSVVFHRVIKGFMIQTGDPDGDGTGGESIWGETFEDEIDSSLSHEAGTVSMANAGPNTNGSQFFITCQATPHLDGKHTIFGKVIKGLGVVRQIESAKTDKHDRPLQSIRIESVSVHFD